MRDIESLSRRTHAVMLELVAEADSRGIAVERGFRNTQQLLAGTLQLSAAEARTRVQHATMVGTGARLPGRRWRRGCPPPPPRWPPGRSVPGSRG
ncbi:MAG: DUF222 domain-containing protein [Pseudonocardiaceae bacterium]